MKTVAKAMIWSVIGIVGGSVLGSHWLLVGIVFANIVGYLEGRFRK